MLQCERLFPLGLHEVSLKIIQVTVKIIFLLQFEQNLLIFPFLPTPHASTETLHKHFAFATLSHARYFE